jgi:hypothetical protein
MEAQRQVMLVKSRSGTLKFGLKVMILVDRIELITLGMGKMGSGITVVVIIYISSYSGTIQVCSSGLRTNLFGSVWVGLLAAVSPTRYSYPRIRQAIAGGKAT